MPRRRRSRTRASIRPVPLEVWWTPTRYGPASGDEYAEIKRQLDESGLFDVTLESTEWNQYSEAAFTDKYPAYQLGWFPDYPDADNYTAPSTSPDSFLNIHYENEEMDEAARRGEGVDRRRGPRGRHSRGSRRSAPRTCRTSPTSQLTQVAVVRDGVEGVVGHARPVLHLPLLADHRRTNREHPRAEGGSARHGAGRSSRGTTRCTVRDISAPVRADAARARDPDAADPADDGLPADAGGAGRPDHMRRSAGAVPAEELEMRREAAGIRQAADRAVLRVHRRRAHARSRHDDQRRPPGNLDHHRERRGDARADDRRFCDRARRSASPLGLLAGRQSRHQRSTSARGCSGSSIYAAPVFFTGFLAQLVFGHELGWLPSSGPGRARSSSIELNQVTHFFLIDSADPGRLGRLLGRLSHLILPAMTLGPAGQRRLDPPGPRQPAADDAAATTSRPRAPAASPSAASCVNHAFRNALVPVVTVAGLQFAILLGGAVLTEQTFNWPGIGAELVRYLNERDYIAVQGIITIFALAVVLRLADHRPHQRLHRPPGAVLN